MRVQTPLAIVLLLTLMSQGSVAHTDHDKARFVAADGQDTGKCDNRFRPCKTLAYAARQANKGDKLLVAEGEYAFTNHQESQLLNDSLVPVLGGFSRTDHFQTQKPNLNKTTLVNVPPYLSETLYRKGFDSIVDGKSNATQQQVAFYQQGSVANTQIQSQMTCSNGMAGQYACNNVALLSHVPINQLSEVSTAANDIWGHVDLNTRREYALVGMRASIVVVDVTSPDAPEVIGEVRGQSTTWRDIKVFQFYDATAKRFKAYAYASADSVTEGFTIIDLNNLPNSVSLLKRNNDDNRAHNIYISNVDYTLNIAINSATPLLHLTGQDSNGGAFRSYSLIEPQTPTAAYIPSSLTRSDYAHDASSMRITDPRAQSECVNGTPSGCTVMLDFNESELRLWDHTDTNTVEELGSVTYNDVAYTHSGWFSEDKRYAFVHDELDERNFNRNTRVMVFDISSLTAPVLAGVWTSDNQTIDHNGYVRGNRYYMSNYERGLTVLDITNPTTPTEVGFFDTYPAADSSSFNGAWGVYPFLPSGNILVSDIQGGLFVLKDNTLEQASATVAFAEPILTTDANTTLSIPVNKTGNGPLTVDYQIIHGSTDTDDIVPSTGELTWPEGDINAKTISIDVMPNQDDEGNETFYVRLFNPQGGGILPGKGYTAVEVNGQTLRGKAEFSVEAIQTLEIDNSLTINVNRSGGVQGNLNVDYALVSDSATENDDFQMQAGSIEWADGESATKTIEISIINDDIAETEEKFSVVLRAETTELLGSVTETVVTIKDDESNQAPVVNAGEDWTIEERATLEITGSAQDPEGALTSVKWAQSAGVEVEISNAETLTMSFTAPEGKNELEFTLTATDEFGVSATDSVTVEVTSQDDANVVTGPPAPIERNSGGGSVPLQTLILLTIIAAVRSRFLTKKITKRRNTEQK